MAQYSAPQGLIGCSLICRIQVWLFLQYYCRSRTLYVRYTVSYGPARMTGGYCSFRIPEWPYIALANMLWLWNALQGDYIKLQLATTTSLRFAQSKLNVVPWQCTLTYSSRKTLVFEYKNETSGLVLTSGLDLVLKYKSFSVRLTSHWQWVRRADMFRSRRKFIGML